MKIRKAQNETKRGETKKCNPQLATTIHDKFFLTISTTRQILTISLLAEETLFTGAFQG